MTRVTKEGSDALKNLSLVLTESIHGDLATLDSRLHKVAQAENRVLKEAPDTASAKAILIKRKNRFMFPYWD